MTDKEKDNYIQELENNLLAEQTQSVQNANLAANSMFMGEQDANLIEFQLSLDNILERIDHLLRGHTIGYDEEGNYVWKETKGGKHKILTSYGAQEVIRNLSVYLNRNTILSNYTNEEIKLKVYDISILLTDLIFTKDQDFFYTPTYDEAKELYLELLKMKQERKRVKADLTKSLNKLAIATKDEDLQKVYLELKQLNFQDKKEEIKDWLDKSEKEIENIREQVRKGNAKHYDIIIKAISDAIHSAYNRALGGGERRSVQRNMMVTQSENPAQGSHLNPPMPIQRRSKWNPINILRA